MITDYVPGAYVTHDQLHIRGGHQTSWLIDGVPVPNTNIASNVGPQFDPKDIDYLEVSRGSYGAEFGDRTYGVFNVVPRTGFERNNEAELVLSAGNFYQTNDQLSFGSHTERFAYYASVNGNRSNLGIQTPVPQVVHDAANGYGGFGSLIFNVDPSNQLRFVTSLRKDYYQIPYDPELQRSREVRSSTAAEPRDGDRESDAILNFSWVHTFNSKLLLTVSPFYHYNSANYESSAQRLPDRHDRPALLKLRRRSSQLQRQPFAQQSAGRILRILSEGQSDRRHYFQLRDQWRSLQLAARMRSVESAVALRRSTVTYRRTRRLFYRRQVQARLLAHTVGRHAPHAFLRWPQRECQSAPASASR